MDGTYGFAGARFEPRSGVLTISDKVTTLRPRTAAVFAYLLDRPGQLVTKEELLRAVWSDLVVTENSLAQCVKEIRREFGDTEERLVKTVHRRGYVLDGPVERSDTDDGSAAPAKERRRLSLMVLPLDFVGDAGENDYFAQGLTDDLTTDLGGIPGTFVISRATAQTFSGRRTDAREIGRELGVAYLVEGSVRRIDDQIIVNLGLTDTRDARQLWMERFEGSRSHLQALPHLIAGKIVQRLHYELMHAESERIALAPNPDAQDLATRAWWLFLRNLPDIPAEADVVVERALALDPDCIAALTTLAQLRVNDISTRRSKDHARSLEEAESAIRRVLSRDPEHRTVNSTLAIVLTYRERFEEALGAMQRQMTLNPNLANAHHWSGVVHLLMGNAHLAIAAGEMAIELSPRDPRLSTFIRNIALAQLHLGNDAEGLVIAERSVRVPKVWPRSYETLAAAYAVNGLMEEAKAAVAMLLQHWPGYTVQQHRSEIISHRPLFLAQRERLLEGLLQAGLPER